MSRVAAAVYDVVDDPSLTNSIEGAASSFWRDVATTFPMGAILIYILMCCRSTVKVSSLVYAKMYNAKSRAKAMAAVRRMKLNCGKSNTSDCGIFLEVVRRVTPIIEDKNRRTLCATYLNATRSQLSTAE